jgi:triosephosphate isomerase
MKLSAALSLLSLGAASAFVSQQSTAGRHSTELFARKAFMAGNWKMNPTSKAEAVNLAQGIAAAVTNNSPCDVGIFVPFPYIETVQNIVGDKLVVGAEVRNILRFVTKCSSSAFFIQ